MPVVIIKMLEGRSVEQKRALARGVTDAVVAALAVPPETVRVLMEELDRSDWAVGGELLADTKKG